MEELDKKIADWLGWEFDATGERFRFHSGSSGWLYSRHLPKFTKSPDVCFEYIVPKLDKLGYVFTLYRYYTIKDDFKTPDEYGFGVKIYKYGEREQNLSGISAETSALALCRAVEKLVDES